VTHQALEALPLAAEFHDAPLFWGWPHSGGLSAEQAASENRAAADGGQTTTMTKKKPLYAWGQRCWQPGLDHVLVAVPYNPGMVEALQQRLADTLSRLECGSQGMVTTSGCEHIQYISMLSHCACATTQLAFRRPMTISLYHVFTLGQLGARVGQQAPTR